jgi:hypothetical protein
MERRWWTGANGFPPRERRTTSASGGTVKEVLVIWRKVCGKGTRREVNCFVRVDERKGRYAIFRALSRIDCAILET